MSRPRLDRQMGLIAALPTALVSVALAACAGAHAGPGPPRPSATAPRASPTGPPAEHVYGPAPTSQAPSARTHYPPQHPPFSDPRLVALAEAEAVCNFDWRQTLATRIARAQRVRDRGVPADAHRPVDGYRELAAHPA